ncbi:ATP-dependent dethiobiotin synthetase BioD [Pedobacter sp. Bi27]|uniref:dethiobiotin synthase n=1 Tax=unclassified Pedobacter TaxID=2628915 RepID=UPI001D8DED46|nr:MULTISPECIES: dethiobiotin synthase [unclassified Pedobacter]CAH0150513.1 ATP-dependent dethiobiotin synthetase BioD [Pedobacter sp. Bi36]CAH0206602.1 ATP-dependent dethiobiotin synthetase BioD [Pedobacter sp. Bi126]CAH0264758.1 ATP-dependent dethiobiotin synthetase BioD [Pedobacter sp. Bi27]
MAKYFITGIGTGIGKTLISAILTEKLKADYWKPIQSGDLDTSDSITLGSLISNNQTVIQPESYRLTRPLSPHLSARLDGMDIDLKKINMPLTENNLIIEGAGGLMVPLNEKELIIDLIKKLNVEVILVSQNYLGSINHTLLSVNLLKQYEIPIKGIIFNGDENVETERYIQQYTKIKKLGNVPSFSDIDKEKVKAAGQNLFI